MSYRSPGHRRRAAWAATKPTNTVAPAVTGTAQVGQTLTTTSGTWTGNTPTFSYQWKRGATNVGTDSTTYTCVAGDVGFQMSCVVTASNEVDVATATSNQTAAVIA